MNKAQAVEFLKTQGMENMSVRTLERHTSEGRIAKGQAKGKTGMIADYSEEALLAYKSVEEGRASLVIPAPSLAPASPPSPKPAKISSTALARLPFLSQQALQRVDDEATPKPAKAAPDTRQVAAKLLWTLDEAALMTGLSKARIRAAIDEEALKGGLVGRGFKVRPSDVKEWADKLF